MATDTVMSRKPRVSALILDLDNTLYDWLGFFVPAFYAMVGEAVRLLGIEEERLLTDIQAVHQRYGNTEQPFALLEAAVVQECLPDLTPDERFEALAPAFDAFDEERRRRLVLYPKVEETLTSIARTGCRIFGYTEATDVNIVSRSRHLGLASLIAAVYAPSFVGQPHPLGEDRPRSGNAVEVRRLAAGARKPDPDVLLLLLKEISAPRQRCLYVGDSLEKDVAMANAAGVMSAWSEYGVANDAAAWQKLVRVTHWTPSAVDRATTGDFREDELPTPTVTLGAFDDLLRYFVFTGE